MALFVNKEGLFSSSSITSTTGYDCGAHRLIPKDIFMEETC